VQVAGGAVQEYVYKPDDPDGNLISNEIFVFRPDPLLDTLDALAEVAGDDGLEDLGDELLPRLVDAGGVREHRFDGYWRDVGTIPAYFDAHRELLGDEPPIDLDDPRWPILTRATAHLSSARVLRGASVQESRLAPGARVAGTVERSVIGRGASVEAGATIRDAIVLPGAVVRAGATVRRAILDDGVEVAEGVTVGGDGDAEIALVGLRATVGQDLPPGARHPEVGD
jgi:glucose-1-phosphate adenylyltransferase